MKIKSHYFERMDKTKTDQLKIFDGQECNYVLWSDEESYVGHSGRVRVRMREHFNNNNYEGHSLMVFTYSNIDEIQARIIENRLRYMCNETLRPHSQNQNDPVIQEGCTDWDRDVTEQYALQIKDILEPYSINRLKDPNTTGRYYNYKWESTYREGRAAVYQGTDKILIYDTKTNQLFRLKSQSPYYEEEEYVLARLYDGHNLVRHIVPYVRKIKE